MATIPAQTGAREAVAVFGSAPPMEAAIDDLLSSGFDRPDRAKSGSYDEDLVEEAGNESFPASDPPCWMP